MKITIIQPETIWEDKTANIKNTEKIIQSHFGKTDIIVLPEMFNTGFTLNAETLAEGSQGETFRWMTDFAVKGDVSICGSLIVGLNNKFYNRFYFITPQEESFTYDKRHLFSIGGENDVYTCGTERKVFDYKGFRFLPLICYDLRFPVWCRNTGDYDVLICVASWPDVRREAWSCLLKARAIENQCYVIGVNNTGADNIGFRYAGDSVVIDPAGKILGMVNKYEEGSATVDISLSELQNCRERFPAWKDRDDFKLEF